MTKCPQCLNVSFETSEICTECGAKLEENRSEFLAELGISETEVTKILSDKSMTPENWERIKYLFSSALEMKEEARNEFLENECGDDPVIRDEVEHLLAAHREDDDFLEDSVVAEVASMFGDDEAPTGDGDEADAARFEPGTLVDGRYEIVELLGKGGMGEVFLAYDKKVERKVALKVLPSELTDSKKRLGRFEVEARAVSALNHPHILTIYEFGKSEDGVHFIASEYVEGKTLLEHEHFRNLTLNRVLDIAMQVASALAAAHEAGITHRDIKPDNIMVRKDGYIKVLDFGLAKLTDTGPTGDPDSEATTKAMVNTAPGSVMGTAAYMSPEQARGLAIDARTDIWSLGVILYELITGRRPFRGDTSTDTIISVIKSEPPPITSFVSNVPSEIEWVVSKTLSKELDGRYQTAKELHADLAKIKKRVEFNEEIERSGTPSFSSRDENGESPTINLERFSTDAELGTNTKELTEGVSGPHDSHPKSSLEYAVTKAARNKTVSAAIAIVLLAAVSTAAYFAFSWIRGSDQIDSIAVLPFENGSKDEALKYLGEGISESLIDRFSQISQLKVIARNSSFKFRGDKIDFREIADQLGVRAIVTGRVEQVNGDLTITVDVVDVSQNQQLLLETFNRKADDLIAIQNEIAQNVSEKLRLKLTSDQEIRLSNGGTTNPEAYRYYLNGLVELRGPMEARSDAIESFIKAVELDPNFAQAHTEISFVYSNRAIGSGNPGELMPKAKEYALKALNIDENLAPAHVALATVKEFEFDWQGAEASYKTAIALNPNLDTARNRYGFFLSVMGRQKEALLQNEQAMLRDPINRRLQLQFKAMNLMQARDFDEAIKTLDEAGRIDPSVSNLNFDYGYAYAGKGLYKEAAAEFKKSVENLGGEKKYSQSLVYMAAAYAKIPEKRAEAVSIAKRLETTDEYVSPAIMAIIYSALGEKEKGIEALEKAFAEKDVLLRYVAVGYEYDGLRSDPRFQDLLKRIGLKGVSN